MILRVWNPIIRNKNDSLKFEVVCRLVTTNRFKDFEKKEINLVKNMVGRFPFLYVK